MSSGLPQMSSVRQISGRTRRSFPGNRGVATASDFVRECASLNYRTFEQVHLTLDNLPDNQLIQLSVEGRLEAFDALVIRYQDRLVHSLTQALGSRDDALEIAQQAFVSAWRRLDSFRQDAAFYSWLYRIAMNAAISRKRQQRLSTTSLDNYVAASGHSPVDLNDGANPEHQLVSEEHVRLVQAALEKLAEEFRQPLVLKEIDGFSYDEIATILEIPIGTVRSRIFRARRELTEQLKRIFPV